MSAEFYGLPVRSLSNAYLRVDTLAHSGPRIVRLFIHGIAENQLAELPGLKIDTALGVYSMYGGHRLWHAPEAMPRTYVPDDHGLNVEEFPGGLRLTGAVEAFSGMQKSIEIRLLENCTGLTLHHTLTNHNHWPVQTAAWAITQLPLGGTAILPQPPTRPEGVMLPNRSLVLWPYTRWNDKRLRLHDDYILIKAEAEMPPCKVGYANQDGWIAYLRNGILLRKRYQPNLQMPHADLGCSTEFYVNHLFIEMETLGPLLTLEPGQSTTHQEIWEFFTGLEKSPQTIGGIRQLLKQIEA